MNTFSGTPETATESPANWDFTFPTHEQLEKEIAAALLNGKFAKRVAMERVQMTHLLKGLARSSVLDYPVRVRHTTELVPDFQLRCNNRRIAVELTRLKFQDVEHARAIQQRGLKTTLLVSGLYPDPSGPRKKRAVIDKGFGTKAFCFGLSVEEEEKAWLKQANEILDTKTAVLARQDFIHGDEDWLVLVDPIGEQSEIERRLNAFSRLLENYWRPGWFARVFLQDNFYRWQMAFTAAESVILCTESEAPPPEVLDKNFCVGAPEAFLFD